MLGYYTTRRVVARRLPAVHWSELAVTKVFHPVSSRELLHMRPQQ